jgi:hypothetical protein
MLAHFWEAAWSAGDGETQIKTTKEIDQDKLVSLYTDHNFVTSYTLDKIAAVLESPEATPNATRPAPKPKHTAATAHRDHARSASSQQPRTQHGGRVAATRARHDKGH